MLNEGGVKMMLIPIHLPDDVTINHQQAYVAT